MIYMERVAQDLGLKVGQEFLINGIYYLKFRITKDGLQYNAHHPAVKDSEWLEEETDALDRLNIGELELTKLEDDAK